MNDSRLICNSIFKNGEPSREAYTAAWITLINNLVKSQRFLARKEERT